MTTTVDATPFPYCPSRTAYQRRRTREVRVGHVIVGGCQPIRIQSMTTTNTRDTDATVAQVIALHEAGCEIVRITAPTLLDARNLGNIRAELRRRGLEVPLVADIHFTPAAALEAAEHVDKVRINPGNFADTKKFAVREYTDEEYAAELRRIEEIFTPLVLKCKARGIAMRIGTNHGSLSDRIMNRYGDTPRGMVESAIEFVRICERHDYRDLILSMKSSNPIVMIQAYRLLAAEMARFGMDYPFHLGVTEAGGGEDGRIKSAIGIGALLEDGIGDTIRVSLTEDPVAEVPVARAIADRYAAMATTGALGTETTALPSDVAVDPYAYQRRASGPVRLGPLWQLGDDQTVRVGLSLPLIETLTEADAETLRQTFISRDDQPAAEFALLPVTTTEGLQALRRLIASWRAHGLQTAVVAHVTSGLLADALTTLEIADAVAYLPTPATPASAWEHQIGELLAAARAQDKPIVWSVSEADIPDDGGGRSLQTLVETAVRLGRLSRAAGVETVVFNLRHLDTIYAYRLLASRFAAEELCYPILLTLQQPAGALGFEALLHAAIHLGALLVDGIGDGLWLEADAASAPEATRLAFNILQVTRLRLTRTEFISCPSCGRTLFDLETTTARIRAKTGHLTGVKIAIMGCIVNGPGEMADADFGYVGWGVNKINLFVGKECVEKNVPVEEADERLIALIKTHGKWVDPPATSPLPQETSPST